jgi:hypothetical protein
VVTTLTARDEGGNEGRSEPFAFRLPERAFTKPLAKALVEQRRNLALDARVRSQVITAVDALTLGPDKFRTEAGIYLGLRSIFWSLVRAKSDDDLREVARGCGRWRSASRTAIFPRRRRPCAPRRRRCATRSTAAPATRSSSS